MKITCLRFVVAGLVACLLTFNSYGQSYAHIHNEDPDGPLPCADPGSYNVQFSVILANLDRFSSTPDALNQDFPDNHHKLYLSYTLGTSYSGVKEMTRFRYINGSENQTDGIKLYQGTIYLYAILNQQCQDNAVDGTLVLPYTMQLMTKDAGGNYVPYPICYYTTPVEIFSCNAFPATSAYCSGALPGGSGGGVSMGTDCDSESLSLIEGDSYFECLCEPHDPDGPGGFGPRNADLTSDEAFEKVMITPNPFQDYVAINWSDSVEEVEELTLFDASGKLLKTVQPNTNDLHLNTEDLALGLYFIQLKNKTNTKVFKLIKQ